MIKYFYKKKEILIMKILYHGEENIVSKAVQELFEKKLEKLNKFDENLSAEIGFSKEGSDFVIKMSLKGNHTNLITKANSNDMYKNIDICVDNLKEQLVKNK